jgi:hypothetical protein
MDAKGEHLVLPLTLSVATNFPKVAGTSERLSIYDLREGHNFARIREYDSPLRYQTRVISIFSDL